MSGNSQDPFDSIVTAEESLYKRGFEEGVKHGEIQGKLDGFNTGQQKGLEHSQEMGFYMGFAEELLMVMKTEGEDKESEAKVVRWLSSLLDQVKQFQSLAFESPNYQENISKIRSRFKQICSVLKIQGKDLPLHFKANLSF